MNTRLLDMRKFLPIRVIRSLSEGSGNEQTVGAKTQSK
jgi:hypothetical protein